MGLYTCSILRYTKIRNTQFFKMLSTKKGALSYSFFILFTINAFTLFSHALHSILSDCERAQM